MLLIGIKINLTKKPTKSITTKPIAIRVAIFVYSAPQNSRREDDGQTSMKIKARKGKDIYWNINLCDRG